MWFFELESEDLSVLGQILMTSKDLCLSPKPFKANLKFCFGFFFFFPIDHLWQRFRVVPGKGNFHTSLLQASGRQALQLVQTGVDVLENLNLSVRLKFLF